MADAWDAIPDAPAQRVADAWDALPDAAPARTLPHEELFAPDLATGLPPAFLDRVTKGEAIKRVMDKAVAGAKEGYGEPTPTGFEDGTLAQLMELGVFHDPSKGGPTPIQFTNEAFMLPLAKGWSALTRGINAGLYATGGIVGQVAEELGASQGMAERARRETINLGNFAMIEGGMGTFSRPRVTPAGPQDHVIGTLPREADFQTGAKVLGGEATEANLKRAWREDGIHPAEAVHDAQNDAFLRHDLTVKQEPVKIEPETAALLEQEGGRPASLSAAATDPPLIPLAEQPAAPPGKLSTAVHNAADSLFDIGRDIQMKVAPMATGTRDSMAIVKDYMNAQRRNRWDWARIDDDIQKNFNPEQRGRMWGAADEESVARQLGESREHQGLVTLEPAERAAVEDLQNRAQSAWLRAVDLGMVEGDGLPAYTPRMVVNATFARGEGPIPLNGIGHDLRTSTQNLRKRKYMTAEETESAAKAKYGAEAYLARDIRVLPMATAQLEDAIAGRKLINDIRDYGKRTGTETVVEGAIPEGSETKWFTIDHPSFTTWRPKFETTGNRRPILDAEGNMVFEKVPLYVHGDFEGPLRAAFWGKTGEAYSAMMALKGKTMSLIMNSPLIHGAVEFGRAFPAMPVRIWTAYFKGNRAKNDVNLMHEAIDNGLVPIGKRFFNQDVTSIMETPDLAPGRSMTAKIAAFIPGLFDEGAGTAVKRAIDKAGDFWHNTLLWDRIADLQMGLYVNMRDDLLAKGIDQQTASRMAAHMANRYAGALPREAMSEAATKFANFAMFSRSFTIGNLGVMKDALTGLPKDVLAQIERDAGPLNPAAKNYAKKVAQRKAFSIVMMDIGLLYIANSVAQNVLNMMLMDQTLSEQGHGYVRRYRDMMNETATHPLSLITPMSVAGAAFGAGVGGPLGAVGGFLGGTALSTMGRLSATADNEPGKGERLKIGYTKDGTAIYARSPFGKIGEEFIGYMNRPIDMLKAKEGTIMRPMMQVLSNDKGFGRKIYDPNAETPTERAQAMWEIIKHFGKSQVPEGQLTAGWDLLKGDGDERLNKLQAFGPFTGFTFSRGAPGGPAVGEMYKGRELHDFAVQQALPDIRKQIQRGDIVGAKQVMDQLKIPPGLQKFYIRTSQFPETRLGGRTLKDFYNYATPQQIERMERARGARP